MSYKNSGTAAPLISHALNEILALGIPRYTCGQLVKTAFLSEKITFLEQSNTEKQYTKVSVHWVSLLMNYNVPRFYFTKMISTVQLAAWHETSIHLVQCTWILIASLPGSKFTSETILQVERDFLAIPAMHFKASAINVNNTWSFLTSNSLATSNWLATFHTAL